MIEYLFVTNTTSPVGVPAKGGPDGICRALIVFNTVPGQSDTTIQAWVSMTNKKVIFESHIARDDSSPHFFQFDVSAYPEAVLIIFGGRKHRIVHIF